MVYRGALFPFLPLVAEALALLPSSSLLRFRDVLALPPSFRRGMAALSFYAGYDSSPEFLGLLAKVRQLTEYPPEDLSRRERTLLSYLTDEESEGEKEDLLGSDSFFFSRGIAQTNLALALLVLFLRGLLPDKSFPPVRFPLPIDSSRPTPASLLFFLEQELRVVALQALVTSDEKTESLHFSQLGNYRLTYCVPYSLVLTLEVVSLSPLPPSLPNDLLGRYLVVRYFNGALVSGRAGLGRRGELRLETSYSRQVETEAVVAFTEFFPGPTLRESDLAKEVGRVVTALVLESRDDGPYLRPLSLRVNRIKTLAGEGTFGICAFRLFSPDDLFGFWEGKECRKIPLVWAFQTRGREIGRYRSWRR